MAHMDLYRYSLSLGNTGGILGVISSVRLSYAMGEYTSTGPIMIIATYATIVSEIYAYVYLYYFLYNFVLHGIIRKRLLFPFVGYLIIIISFTGRTEYIQCSVMVIWMLMFLFYKKDNKNLRNSRELFKRISAIAIFAVALLFVYGFISRNSLADDSVSGTIVSYMCASLYGLDQIIIGKKEFYGINGKSLEFGYYTLQNIYSFLNLLGFEFNIPSFQHLPFYYYETGGSNIYTCLAYPLLDYGFWGMLFSRILLGFALGMYENKIKKLSIHNISGLYNVIFMGIICYDAISSYIADRYYSNLLAIPTLVKYTLASAIIIRFFCSDIKKL